MLGGVLKQLVFAKFKLPCKIIVKGLTKTEGCNFKQNHLHNYLNPLVDGE